MTDQANSETKRSFNVVGLLKTIAIVLAVIVFLTTAITNLLMVYIIFAPDDAPKPFYLMYYLPGQSPQVPIAAVPTLAPAEGNGTAEANANSSEGNTTSGASGAEGGSSAPVSDVMPGTGILLDTGTKIVNLADPGGRTLFAPALCWSLPPTRHNILIHQKSPPAGEKVPPQRP